MALQQPYLFLALCSSECRGRRHLEQTVTSESDPPSPESYPPWIPIFINTKLRVKRLKIRWLNHSNDLSSHICYLKASLPLCVCALGYVKPWFRAWTFLLIPFTKFWAMPFADYSPDSEFLPGHIPTPGFFYVFSKYFQQTCYANRFPT